MSKKIIKNLLTTIMLAQLSLFSTNLSASEEKIKIDIVSDVVCPWCAIGYKRLKQAIDEMAIQDRVELEWHPFELNPTMPKEGQNANKYLMQKYNLSDDELKKTRANVTELGEESGFKFNYFEKMKKLNTFDAHILLNYAKKYNKQTELEVRLSEAYFSEKKDISDRNILYLELKNLGLNANEGIAMLENIQAIQNLKEEEQYWRKRGVSAIPTMFFNDSIMEVGANSVETYKRLLTQLIKKQESKNGK